MAGHVLRGEAVRGRVVNVDAGHMERGRRRAVHRPLVVIETRDPCRLPIGKELWWSGDPGRVCCVVEDVKAATPGGSRVTIKITGGLTPPHPQRGQETSFSIFTTRGGPWLPLPSEIPWTHQPTVPVSPPAIDDTAPAWENAG
jgi:hypothetical protein